MSSLTKKRKSPTTKTKTQSLTVSEHLEKPSLPYDLVVSILARVSRSYYTNLSLVSKSFRSILASPELYQTRNLLGRTETFLYVCLRFPDEANPRWFTLYRKKPNQTLTKKKKKTKREDSSVYLLAPTQILDSPHEEWSSLIAVGSYLYAITAAIHDSPCSNVWFLDCRTNTWLEAPRTRLAHTNSGFDGKMYLAGSSESPGSLNCVEVYNTETQAWNPVPSRKRIFEYENMEGKIYLNLTLDATNTKEDVALKPKVWTWETVGLDTQLGSVCMIDNIAFHYDPRVKFIWKKNKSEGGGIWRRLKGLEGLPKFANYSTVKLADYGGKLVVLWDKYLASSGYKEKMIWCAEISLDKRNTEEIWGKVEWFDAVLTVPKSYKFVCAKSATV
ncbi:hypothetical protein CARUB_v10028060mg [Capsella rubella]|uniref:F-box domain-containing protein n=1 Tax=Capsella rubella TaxID=81985 RepID=R0GU94_9BRAS|nr:F-box/kelch-repeat protein At5g48990 [Capsella rubella]XP_023633468.1 F-box/kelch-repeat protein At5g48990 [Capsella rubella]XP_023633470.1 F-box/kelch-repeat protein At5g48990 [Capsella rubella]EOA14763.1 hypothetical protein CARUB_v10028060mg [Capsella rubella]